MHDARHLHHIPAALQPPRPVPPPIAMPARTPNARTADSSESAPRRWARMGAVIDEARAAGHADGVFEGYGQGFQWGLFCGAVSGALVASIAWAVWLTIAAPEVAPPSAARVPTVISGLGQP